MASSQGIEGHHLIPQAIANEFSKLFESDLPGWELNRGYNLTATSSLQKASVQMGTLMHSGGYYWIDKFIGIDPIFTSEIFAERLKAANQSGMSRSMFLWERPGGFPAKISKLYSASKRAGNTLARRVRDWLAGFEKIFEKFSKGIKP